MTTLINKIRSAGFILLVLLGFVLSYPYYLRPIMMDWGSTSEEKETIYPGDELISAAARTSTQAITIEASPPIVWDWIAQMGADKAGFYSYTWIQVLLNCPMQNATTIHPEWTSVHAGDIFRLCPEHTGPPPYEVILVKPGEAFVLGHRAQPETGKLQNERWIDTLAFIVQPVGKHSSRLIVRTRAGQRAGWMTTIEPGFFVMERGMLKGLKARAEEAPIDPSIEAFYKLLFGLLTLIYLITRYRSWFTRINLAKKSKKASPKSATSERLLEWLVTLLHLPVLIYPLTSWLDTIHLALPDAVRLIGAGLFLGGNLLLIRERKSADAGLLKPMPNKTNYSILETPEPTLPPERFPYPGMFMITFGMFLLSANWLVGLPYFIALFFIQQWSGWPGKDEPREFIDGE